MQSPKNYKFSIFVKLFLLVIVFTTLINISIGFIIRLSFDGPGRPPGKLSYFFNDYFLKDIGNPPDTVKARSVMKDLGLNIRFETSKSNWASSESVPTIEELRNEDEFDENKSRFTIRTKGRFYEITRTDDGYIVFAPPMPRDDINIEKTIVPVIFLITVFSALLYFSLRWIFGPIKILSSAVRQISSGNFDTEIDIDRRDEFGNLADTINEMKTNISNMIRAKESLLIDVSHELRSPLTRIKLANEFVSDEKISSKIKDDVKEMESMIKELLDTYRLEKVPSKINFQDADLIRLVRNVIAKFGDAKINFSSDFETKYISLDKEKIEIVLRNIIDNAIKYSGKKPVDVRIYQRDSNGKNVSVSVKDQGNGIPEEEINNIFEPFYRIDKSRDKKILGYGLGLSIVKKILDIHNYKIEIKSSSGKGTEFIIDFKMT